MSFQSQSGYQTCFIENLRRLSPEYDAYLRVMDRANRALIRRFPEAEALDSARETGAKTRYRDL